MRDKKGRLQLSFFLHPSAFIPCAMLPALWACHHTAFEPQPGETAGPPTLDTATEQAALIPAGPERVVIPQRLDDRDRWLFVRKVRDGAPGAWATGSFIPARNKIEIETRDVRRFAVDVSLIPIDWDRLVIIGINGANSELRKRDYSILHFARDGHGRWVVVEP